MAMRVSGINSGLDTEALVGELVNAYSKKTEKYEKQLTKNEWKTEAWEDLNKDIYGLYTDVSNMRYTSAYSFKNATSSDTSKATVTASSSAINVSQKLSVNSIAQTSYLTGGQLLKSTTADTKLSQLGYTGGKNNILVYGADGTKTTINIDGSTTVKDFLKQLEKAGLNASFDETSKRIFVSAKESGSKGDFTLMGQNAAGQDALTKLGLSTALYTKDAEGNKNFAENSYLGSLYQYYRPATDDKTAEENTRANILKIIEDGYQAEKKNYDAANTARLTLTSKKNSEKSKLAEMEAARESFDKAEYDANMQTISVFKDAHPALKDFTNDQISSLSHADYVKIIKDDMQAQKEAEKLKERRTEEGDDYELTEEEKAEIAASLETDEVNEAIEKEITEVVDALNATRLGDLSDPATFDAQKAKVDQLEADYQQQYDALTAQMEYYSQRMADSPFANLMQTETGVAYDNERRATELDNYINSVMEVANMLNSAEFGEGVATQVHGSDAEIVLNGVKYTNNTNSFSVNGLNISVTNKTAEDSPITLSVTTDTQAVYDKVKEFLTKYNEIINKITKLYNADSAKDFEPLTDEEKDAMSDTEIEKWEAKIKSSLLRRDTSLSSIMTAMMNSMMASYEIDGKKYSLTTFGIHTLGYLNAAENEQNAFHIDGDADDEKTAGNEEKLMEAINNNPDTLIEFMKKLTTGLYQAVDTRMKSNSLRSAFKVYNDKELKSEAASIKSTISKWEKKVTEQEDYYYKKFAAMEKALGNMNSQQTAFTNMLGMN